jgi:SAM-dependent methyltransferase
MRARRGGQIVAVNGKVVKASKKSARDYSWLAFFDAGLKTLQTLETYLASGEQSKRARDHGCFGHVSLDAKQFLRDLHKARAVLSIVKPRTKQSRFLDVGCGVGMKVQLASHVFATAHGLEFDQTYFNVAQRVRDATLSYGIDFFHGDALRFDDFGSYDVVYLYRPMKDIEKQSELEDRIAANVKKDAIVIAHLCGFHRFSRRRIDPQEIGLERLFDTIYVKAGERRIQAIRERLAAQTGHLSTVWW